MDTFIIHVELATVYNKVEYWYAVTDQYDGPEDIQGSGHSKWEAVADLIEQMERAGY